MLEYLSLLPLVAPRPWLPRRSPSSRRALRSRLCAMHGSRRRQRCSRANTRSPTPKVRTPQPLQLVRGHRLYASSPGEKTVRFPSSFHNPAPTAVDIVARTADRSARTSEGWPSSPYRRSTATERFLAMSFSESDHFPRSRCCIGLVLRSRCCGRALPSVGRRS